jgi:hypothetical protein
MIGKPIHIPKHVIGARQLPKLPSNPPKETKGGGMSVNYIADVSGCGHYRMIWPSQLMNSSKSMVISDCRRVILDPSFYKGVETIRLQRQVDTNQLNIFKHLRKIADKVGARIIYEIDDIPFYEDIPVYNQNRKSFARQDYRMNIETMMNMADEVTVTTKFMRDYFIDKLDTDNVTAIPNYMPKSWMDRYYNEEKLKINLSKNKKKPRILYAGSGSHYGSANVEDDFTALEKYVRQTVNQYQWVFFGGMPRGLFDLEQSGKIEFHNYSPVSSYAEVFSKLKAQVAIAPLLKNNFNKAKSNIKFIETAAFGIPCICQDDIVTYDDSIYRFNTPSELDDQIKALTKDASCYMKAVRKSRMAADQWWLEDNITQWEELYKHPFGSAERVELNKLQ